MTSTKPSLFIPSSRTIILSFDGTDEQFQPKNTNVIKLVNLLEKGNREQLLYYQPGIGTYAAPGVMAGLRKWFAMVIDQAVAWYLDIHIMGGYTFLMDNYQEGDRICLFGFSRGAYTARALAGMLHKVGLLPVGNLEQVGFAYNIYKNTGRKSGELAAQFKKTFSKPVSIEFIGCWDTVSSVGVLFSRRFPFTDDNSSIKYFRHAVSLDEHRAKFRPNLYHRCSPNDKFASGNPENASDSSTNPTVTGSGTDVLEVWFAGCHTDVGGSATPPGTPSLSDITLRWMIRQIVISQCGITFNADALAAEDIPLSILSPSEVVKIRFDDKILEAEPLSPNFPSPLYSPAAAQADSVDATKPLHDSLKSQPLWWVIEFLPFFVTWQDESGTWHRRWRWNLGRPRKIYDYKPNMHVSVQERMQNIKLNYTPRAVWKGKPDAVWCY